MAAWFEESDEIACSIQDVKDAIENHGEHFVAVTSLMPGLTTVELVEQGADSATIKTNEGLMERTSISKQIEADRVVLEFDEKYAAGSKVTVTTHFANEFTTSGSGVAHRVVLSNVEAPGFLGLMYRRFGSKNIGKAYMAAVKEFFEAPNR